MSPVTTESSQPAQPAPEAPQSAPADSSSSGNQNQQLRIAVLVVIAALVALGMWLAFKNDDPAKKSGPKGNGNITTAIGPKAYTVSQLRDQSARLASLLYWAGPKKNNRYEFTRTTNGRLYVRYLPKGVGNNQKKGQLLIVATYPWAHPLAALKEASKNGTTGKGGAYIIRARPGDQKSVLVAWPQGTVEVEVFSPIPGKAQQIAASGALTTVG
jgi:hypothetical protein